MLGRRRIGVIWLRRENHMINPSKAMINPYQRDATDAELEEE